MLLKRYHAPKVANIRKRVLKSRRENCIETHDVIIVFRDDCNQIKISWSEEMKDACNIVTSVRYERLAGLT